MKTTYDVRVHGLLTNKVKKGSTYSVRWKVAGRPFRDTFATKALAESTRSKLLVAQREGLAFDTATGLPEPLARAKNSRTWLELAMDFVDMKWPHSAPLHRRNTAEALTTVTLAFITSDRGAPPEKVLRAALKGWAFNTARRRAGGMPESVQSALAWLTANTVNVVDLDDAALMRKALDAVSLRLDGTPAAASTVARKRTALSSALKYAVELRLLPSHPLARITWSAPRGADEVDRRTVVNPAQAAALLSAVRHVAPELEAFFACMYYSALRPEEVLHLKERDYERPSSPGEWAWFNLTGATVAVGEEWSGTSARTEDRELKHRGKAATRRVPVPPPLVELLDAHLSRYGTGADGRIFVTQRGPTGRYRPTDGQPLSSNAYQRAWKKARRAALTDAQHASPLARVPYHLRHAAVSLWLNAGVPATQVAEWAGHSVAVLLRTYAKCVDGEEDAARRRVEAALGVAPSTDGPPADPVRTPTRIRHSG